jgi:hypothetical protein
VAYERELNEFRDRQEKAAGDILAHQSRLQRTHVADHHHNPAPDVGHDQGRARPAGPRHAFQRVQQPLLDCQGPGANSPRRSSRVGEAIACVVKLRPATVTESSASLGGGSVQTTRNYSVGNLDNELALTAMLRALPREEYANFVSSLVRQKDLSRDNVEAAFQVEQTERNAHRGPLLSPSGDAALRTAAQPPRQNKPGVKCGFCTGEGHNGDACYKKDRARKDAQKAVEEHCANRNSGKQGRANRAATPSSLSPAPSDSTKVTELAASASVRLASSPDTHTDANWITDTGATSHMSPRPPLLVHQARGLHRPHPRRERPHRVQRGSRLGGVGAGG